MHVLIIDNDEDFVTVWRYILSKHGFEVREAARMSDVERVLHTHPIDLIICDIDTIETSLSDFCSYIRSLSVDKRIPIIVVGELGSEGKRAAYLRAGASSYIEKPFSQTELLHILENIH